MTGLFRSWFEKFTTNGARMLLFDSPAFVLILILSLTKDRRTNFERHRPVPP